MKKFSHEELQEVLEKHKLWLVDTTQGERTNLSGANIDYSCLPLWCGSKDMVLDDRLQAQLLGHIIDACKNVKFTDEQIGFVYRNWERANEFLRGAK